MKITNFDQLLSEARNKGPRWVSLAACHDKAALAAVIDAHEMGLAEARLFGDHERTRALLAELGASETGFLEIQDVPDAGKAAAAAVASVKRGEADILLKGKVQTGTFLRAVLDSAAGLRTGRLLSDVLIFEDNRSEEPRLIMITDGGVNLAPTLEQKIEILRNAVSVAHKLGNMTPAVALLSAIETVQPELTSTVDAALIAKMGERGQLPGCHVDGPLALDNAVSPEAAQLKGLSSPAAGQADILLCPTIESANMLAKGVTFFADFRLAHVIVGATAPILIPSRADTSDAKLLSIALGCVMCE